MVGVFTGSFGGGGILRSMPVQSENSAEVLGVEV